MIDSQSVPCLDIAAPSCRDVEPLAVLFEAYRRFYKQPPDAEGALRFVTERLEARDTHFFLARIAHTAAGFVHLLPSFDTLAMRPMWILEDLFVDPAYRRRGIASALLAHAEAFARTTGASRLSLTTAHDNAAAQRRYLAHGYVHDTVFRAYHRSLM